MKITIKNLQKKVPVNPKRIKRTILKAFSAEREVTHGEITVCLLSDQMIQALNSRYLGKNIPTDVIAFDLGAKKGKIIGDIAVSADTALRNAKSYHTSLLYEIELYIIHGILHLLGYDDKTARQKTLMRRKEEKLMEKLTKVNLFSDVY